MDVEWSFDAAEDSAPKCCRPKAVTGLSNWAGLRPARAQGTMDPQSPFLRDADPRRGDLDSHPLEATQKREEFLRIVSGEDAADFEIPQPRSGDLDRFGRVAIEFGRNTRERFVVERNLSMQPRRGALHIDDYRPCCGYGARRTPAGRRRARQTATRPAMVSGPPQTP